MSDVGQTSASLQRDAALVVLVFLIGFLVGAFVMASGQVRWEKQIKELEIENAILKTKLGITEAPKEKE